MEDSQNAFAFVFFSDLNWATDSAQTIVRDLRIVKRTVGKRNMGLVAINFLTYCVSRTLAVKIEHGWCSRCGGECFSSLQKSHISPAQKRTLKMDVAF